MHCMAAFCRKVAQGVEGRSLYVIAVYGKSIGGIFLWLRENYLALGNLLAIAVFLFLNIHLKKLTQKKTTTCF